uniref:Sulfatase n=1 Tax=Candidatus Kentrum sp. DK TaxID=2126562 RepID=A0A450TI39_9GAMM|nr:MAG: Sulfatase [Candidatus Kentron sp. DK]
MTVNEPQAEHVARPSGGRNTPIDQGRFRAIGFDNYYLGLLRQTVTLQLLFLLLLSLFRLGFFLTFSPPGVAFSATEVVDAFVLGFRIDLVVVSYLTVLPLLLVIINHAARNLLPPPWLARLFSGYFSVVYILVWLMIGIDLGYFSFFGEHVTLLIFGFFDDDTAALIKIAWKNYNVPLILGVVLLFAVALVRTVRRMFTTVRPSEVTLNPWWMPPFYLFLVALVFLGARGGVGLFPLIKNIPDVSADAFVNALPQNGVIAFEKAIKQYYRAKSGAYDLIGEMGYAGRVPQAFRDFLGNDGGGGNDPVAALARTTPGNPAARTKPPHVVVVMVESFGTPILKYQSPRFDILRRLKRHFDQDILFTNFISGANGTIVSLEPLLLNVLARPRSISYGQSAYLGVDFPRAAARVYQKAGHETSFIYSGDLSWRNVGSFFRRQGFDRVEGKSNIKAIFPDAEEHDWGVYDQY